ncbi:MAG: FkbM family methyltransferase [Chloroflexi bacterium]|nr:FkbM family methyltransferase [Chloroflexota bacterium]
MFYAFYRSILNRYQRNPDSLFSRLVQIKIRWAVAILQRSLAFHFPGRATGGWWWIERFRFEILMRWLEYESVERVRQIVKPGMTVIDIGAHIGYYTRLLSELAGPKGRVLAFEPNPENFDILKKNMTPRRYNNVELFNCAVGDREGTLPLYVSPGNSNHSLIQGYTEAQGVIEVRVVALDSFLRERGIEQIDFVKSDTEGAEPLVLAGMKETAARSPQLHLLMELNPTALRCGGVEPEQFLDTIRRMGFEIEMIRSDLSAKEGDANMLCRKLPK